MQLKNFILQHLNNPLLSNVQLAEELDISERLFYLRIKEITGKTPNQYIRGVRLEKAKELLETKRGITVKEVAYEVGYLKVDYFSDLFNAKYQCRPSALISRKGEWES